MTRLVPQKGVHLIKHSIYRTLERGGQYILLGSSPVPQIQVYLLMNHFRTSRFFEHCKACLINFTDQIYKKIAVLFTNLSFLEQNEFEGLARQFENHPQIRLVLKYDEALSHAIYAAADIFVIPSIFEPCGLTQVRHF